MADPIFTIRHLLILGGTAEARALARAASALPGLKVTTSLAGRTRDPAALAGEVHVGGFGGADGLARYLDESRIDLVIDATHPFAARISRHAAEACAVTHRPLLMLLRPPWTREGDDNWIEVADVPGAAAKLGALARAGRAHRAFITVGRQELAPFAAVHGIEFMLRLVERPETPLPLPGAELVIGRGPFTFDAECALLTNRGVDTLVSKNSGGEATYGKIAAARELGLPVIMVTRPDLPDVERVSDVAAALDWVVGHAG